MRDYKQILERLAAYKEAPIEGLRRMIEAVDGDILDYAASMAREVASGVFSRKVYIRGLIEISNRCTAGCYYCGLRSENRSLNRYALTGAEVVEAVREGYALGLRSFVLQGGELHNQADFIAGLARDIKSEFADVALTLSLGEQQREVYEKWFEAGAERYLLRHESATKAHYRRLHPESMSYDNRMGCLAELRKIGYQVGAGFMVGSPFQGAEELAREVEFLLEFQPEMVGIGPFIPQHSTPFAQMKRGGVERTLLMLSLSRLALPKALIPSTTALASSDKCGTIRGIMAGANVVMPNLTPLRYRADYAIYDGKKSSGSESAEGIEALRRELEGAGYVAGFVRGDHPDFDFTIKKEK